MKLNRPAQRIVQSLPDSAALEAFLSGWLAELAGPDNHQPLSQMTTRALMRGAGLLDDSVLRDFQQVVHQENGLRLFIYDMLTHHSANPPLRQPPESFTKSFPWESFLLMVFAEKSGYDPQQFDAASPPQPHTPAGMVLHQAVALLRGQTARSATERDRLARHLVPDTTVQPLVIDEVTADSAAGVVIRPAIPVRYPEFNPDVNIAPDDLSGSSGIQPAIRGAEIKITPDEVAPRPVPQRLTPSPAPRPPQSSTPSAFSRALRDFFRNEPLKTTRLRVIVQEYPDGPGVYGLQVTVASRSIKSFVAGTTDRQGRFLCELPVRLHSGLTYDIDVSWPADFGGATERKSITINADRTEFNLPFYRRLSA